MGEGACVLVVEEMEAARARGARIYAEVVGDGSAADGWDMIQPIEHGAGSARAMKIALERRGVPARGGGGEEIRQVLVQPAAHRG